MSTFNHAEAPHAPFIDVGMFQQMTMAKGIMHMNVQPCSHNLQFVSTEQVKVESKTKIVSMTVGIRGLLR